MSQIHQRFEHGLGLPQARALAQAWVQKAAPALGLSVQHTQGDQEDMIRFERSGVNGALRVSGSVLEVDIQLGLMMKPLKPMIEAEVQKGLARAIEKAAGQA